MVKRFPRLIGLTTWETNLLPSRYTSSLNALAEIWVPCSHNVEVFRKQLNPRVFQVPHPVSPTIPAGDVSLLNAQFGLTNRDFVFYSIVSWQDRKFPLGIIAAFLDAFSNEHDVVLILKTRFELTSERDARTAIAELIKARGVGAPRVKVEGGLWKQELMGALLQRGNCYVSLHRARVGVTRYSMQCVMGSRSSPRTILDR
jgi:hypothetical protein